MQKNFASAAPPLQHLKSVFSIQCLKDVNISDVIIFYHHHQHLAGSNDCCL